MLFPADQTPQHPGPVPTFILPSCPRNHLSGSLLTASGVRQAVDLGMGGTPGVSQLSLENVLNMTALTPGPPQYLQVKITATEEVGGLTIVFPIRFRVLKITDLYCLSYVNFLHFLSH